MKKMFFVSLLAASLLFAVTGTSNAMGSLDLDGKTYDIIMFCMDSVGDYCDQYALGNDEFIFDDDEFEIDSFGDGPFGLGRDGEYSDNGLSFSADYEAYNEDAEKYEFDISGINLLDQIIVGIMQIKYYEWDILSWEKEDDGTAYFIGTEN